MGNFQRLPIECIKWAGLWERTRGIIFQLQTQLEREFLSSFTLGNEHKFWPHKMHAPLPIYCWGGGCKMVPMKEDWVNSNKITHACTLWIINLTSSNLSQRYNGKNCRKTYARLVVTLRCSKRLETTWMPPMGDWKVAPHLHRGVLCSYKEECVITLYIARSGFQHILLREESKVEKRVCVIYLRKGVTIKYMYSYIICIFTFIKKEG